MKKEQIDTNSLAHTKWNCKYHIVLLRSTGEKFFTKINGWIKEKIRIDFNLKSVEVYPRSLKSMFITSITKDCHTNLITKPLSNIESNKGLNNWWFLLSTFT